MASSDDEGEMMPNSVSSYEFVVGKDEPISFAELPVEWNKGETPDGKQKQIFLRGTIDNGLQKIYKQVIAWKFDLSHEKPKISVLSTAGNWINLLKPRRPFEDYIRTILITLHSLHFVTWNPQRSHTALWDHLSEVFSMFDHKPSEDDLVDHISLITEAVKRDGTLAKSKTLITFLEEKLKKRKSFIKDFGCSPKSTFIVEDDRMDGNEDDESDEDDVCAICDNGGSLLICEGKCLRSFHPTVEDGADSSCTSLGYTDAEYEAMEKVDFYCKNCEYKQHQCFACGNLGSSDELSGAEVFRCVNGACGHFYHPHCVVKLLHSGNETAAEEHRKKIAAGEQFSCPRHKCHRCKELEVKSVRDFQFAICRRCPRAYHRKCLPRKIAFEEDMDEGKGIVQRAWEGLIPNRHILIYCLKHEIDIEIATPVRNHIKFPGPQQNEKKQPLDSSSQMKTELKERSFALEDAAGKKISSKPSKGVEKLLSGAKQLDLSKKRVENFPAQGSSKKQKMASNSNSVGLKEPVIVEGDISFGDRSHSTYGTESEPVKFAREKRVDDELEKTQEVKPVAKRTDDSLSLDADTKKRILAVMKNASSSITLEEMKEKHKAPSTHAQSSKFSADFTSGKVEGSVESVRAALQKLEQGSSIKDAKTFCGTDLLIQVMKWKNKLKVYLAPFLYGMSYTSFGRHFTKTDKLKEIVEMLHWYVQDGDMIVDFCCGSNDFSCLMKKKLNEMGKSCSFKNYDILQAKNDFNFERKDWMEVRPNELLEGSQLIMGLHLPSGVNAVLANKFIDKAIEFKPKLLVLIAPRETHRLDEKEFPYDLIWEDDQMFISNSFYLPGSVDANGKQIEDWNVNSPILYLWSCPDWMPKHKAIAEQQGHLSGTQKNLQLEERQHGMHVSDYPLERHNIDKFLVNHGEDDDPDNKQETLERETITTTNLKKDWTYDSCDTEGEGEGDKNRGYVNNQSGAYSDKLFSGRKRKRRSNSNSMHLEDDDNSTSKDSVSHHPSPRRIGDISLDTHSSKHLEKPSHTNRSCTHEMDEKNGSDATIQSEVSFHGRHQQNSCSQRYEPLPDTSVAHNSSVPRSRVRVRPLGFASGPCRPYSQENSAGWLDE